MSKSNGTVNSNLPKMIVREQAAANTTIPPLPVMPEGFQYGGEWMDPQWKKDVRTGKKLFQNFPFQMGAMLLATAGLAIGLGLAGNACAASKNPAVDDGNKGGYSEDYEDNNPGGMDLEGPAVSPDGLLGSPVSGSVGDIDVTIKGYKFADDYDGVSSIMVEYEFTNNGSEPTYFHFLDHKAFQNGVQLTNSYGKTDEYDNQEQILEVQSGATHTVHCLYNLSNTTDPVEVRVGDMMQMTDETVTTTFSLAGENTPAAPVEQGSSNGAFVAPTSDGIERITGYVDDAYIEIFDYNLWEDASGQKYIVISLDETNTGSDPYPASAFYEVYAEQDGYELTHVTGGMEGYGDQFLADLAPGETRQIHLFFRGVNFDGGAASIELYNFFDEEEYVGIEAQMYSLD